VSRWRIAGAVVALAAAAGASAFVRTRDAASGRALSWPVRTVPWHLNREWPDTSPTCQPTPQGDPTLGAARASFAAWEQSCTDLRLVFGGTIAERRTGLGGSAENLVVFRRGWCSQLQEAVEHPCWNDPDVDCAGIFGCFEDDACAPFADSCTTWNVVALTSVLYDPESGRILNADIELNGWDGGGAALPDTQPRNGWYFTCGDPAAGCGTYGQAGCQHMDLQNTLTHEVGHLVGLGHVPSLPDATMFPETGPGETQMRSLSADDVEGVCAIYPDQGDDGGCGCGNGGASSALALAVAALALRRPLRARRPAERPVPPT
jgi:hypothetical protein